MHGFLISNREEILIRCKQKVALRPKRSATKEQLVHGIPMFVDQLIRTLAAEESDQIELGVEISGPPGGDARALSEIGISATAHGKELLLLGYTLDQVVHDYGDVCQAITDLAFEREKPFSVRAFRTLNRCLDNAIADAVTEFSVERDKQINIRQIAAEALRLGFLVHEVRNSMGTAMLALKVLEKSNLPLGGATGAVLKRSLSSAQQLIDRAISEVKEVQLIGDENFFVAPFLEEVAVAARLDVGTGAHTLEVPAVDPTLRINANKQLLHAAVLNLLQNAYKFSVPKSIVTLRAYVSGSQVLIEVEDHCGGLSADKISKMFIPFKKSAAHKQGMGLGLCIARQSIEADNGTLKFRNVPGSGCIFCVSLPCSAMR